MANEVYVLHSNSSFGDDPRILFAYTDEDEAYAEKDKRNAARGPYDDEYDVEPVDLI